MGLSADDMEGYRVRIVLYRIPVQPQHKLNSAVSEAFRRRVPCGWQRAGPHQAGPYLTLAVHFMDGDRRPKSSKRTRTDAPKLTRTHTDM